MFRIKEILVYILAITIVTSHPLPTMAKEASKSGIVVIDGSRYMLHRVEAGQTIYSLTKLYGVSDKELYAANIGLRTEGLKAGAQIKIPYKAAGKTGGERKAFDTHTIAKGETLYSISKKYKISINTIIEDNGSLDPTNLKIGERVNIRRSEQGKSNDSHIEAELKEYGKRMESVDPTGYSYYVTDNGETISIIAKRMGVSKESIARVNNLSSTEASLSKGTILRIETTKRAEQLTSVRLDSDEYAAPVTLQELIDPDQQIFAAKSHGECLNIALLLPLTVNGREVRQFAEFYKGFLLGVEDLKNMEYNVTVNLFDTQRSATRIEYIMTESRFLECDLIVGPVFEELTQPVIDYAEVRNIPVVSPLAAMNSVNSPVLFQMAPDSEYRYDKIESMLNENNTVTLIYGESNDPEYERSIVDLLGRRNMDYVIHSYSYEHPSAISDRNRAAEEFYKEMQRDAEEFGIPLDSTDMQRMLPDLSTSDLTPLVANKAKHNLFFIMSDNETDVDRILSALSSAYNSQRSKNYRRSKEEIRLENRAPSSYNVIANPDWRNFRTLDYSSFFNNRVISLNSYQANRGSKIIREFDSRYAAEFNDFPSRYSYRGYDIAVIFGEGLYCDIMFGLDGMNYTPLQNSYYFEQRDENSNRVNINWMRARYNPNFTLRID